MSKELFTKALKVASVELKEELLWEYPRGFLEQLWIEIKYELSREGEVVWNLTKFLERVDEELRNRGWDIRQFRSSKGEPILNMFKKIIREIGKECNIQVSNDALSRILNFIRNQYSSAGTLIGAVFPVRAFFERDEYGIPDYYKTGDSNSCFRVGGCNYGSSLWLKIEDEKFDRCKLVVFHYKSGNKEGWGRCWVYQVSEWAIFATNFYSWGFEIKSQWLKFPLVRVLRSLFGLSENVKFASGKNICLPIYLNGDGCIVYEKEKYQNSDEVIELSREIEAECMNCGALVKMKYLRRFSGEWEYEGGEVEGLVVCDDCHSYLENMETCEGCGGRFYREDMYYHEDGYWCEDCFNERFERCYVCDEYFWREDMIVDRDGHWLCPDCASEHRRQCAICGEWVYTDEVSVYEVLNAWGIEEVYVCDECEQKLQKTKCECCGREFFFDISDYRRNERIREIVRAGLCYECFRERQRALRKEIFDNEKQPSLPFDAVDVVLI